MKRRWMLILAGSLLGGALAQLGLTSCTSKQASAATTDCQAWAVGQLDLVPPYNGPADLGVAKSTLVPAGWEPFSGESNVDIVYIRKCVQ